MRFQDGLDVITRDGKKLGSIAHMVIEPHNDEVTHLIIEEGFLLKEDCVLPMELVEDVDDDKVTLNQDAAAINLEPFHERYFIPADSIMSDRYDATATPTPNASSWYAFPPPNTFWEPIPAGTTTYLHNAHMPSYSGKVAENVPTQSAIVEEGQTIFDKRGEKVGEVEDVYVHEDTHQVTHVVVSQGWLFTTEKLIPIHWIAQFEDNKLQINVHEDVLNNLPDFDPEQA